MLHQHLEIISKQSFMVIDGTGKHMSVPLQQIQWGRMKGEAEAFITLWRVKDGRGLVVIPSWGRTVWAWWRGGPAEEGGCQLYGRIINDGIVKVCNGSGCIGLASCIVSAEE